MRFVVIGGVALQLHGSAYTTFDLDLANDRTRENAALLARALQSFEPKLRGTSADLPFAFDAQTLLLNEILTLVTTASELDLLATVKGIGAFAEIERLAETTTIGGFEIRVLGIDGLLRAKRAVARPKDRPGIIELEALLEARRIAAESNDA